MTMRSVLMNAARDVDQDVAWRILEQHAQGIITEPEMDYKLAELIADDLFNSTAEEADPHLREALQSAFANYARHLHESRQDPNSSFLPLDDANSWVWPIPDRPTFNIGRVWTECQDGARSDSGVVDLIVASKEFWQRVDHYSTQTTSWAIKILHEMNALASHVAEIDKALSRVRDTASLTQKVEPGGYVYYVKDPTSEMPDERRYLTNVDGAPLSWAVVVDAFGLKLFGTRDLDQVSGLLDKAHIRIEDGEWAYTNFGWVLGRAKVSD